MSAFATPAGGGFAGLSPVLPPIATPGGPGLTPLQWYAQAQGVQTPLVIAYSPTFLGFIQNADGTLQGIHPIDQQVALAMFVQYGSIPSAPTVGSKLRQVLNRVDPQKAPAIALDEVNRCLAPLIASGAIVLLSFLLQYQFPGRWLTAMSYTNLKDPRYNPGNGALPSSGNPAARTLVGSVAGLG